MPKREVKKYDSGLPAGIYRALEHLYTYVHGKLRQVAEDEVISLAEGEANKHFELVSLAAGSVLPVQDKKASILNALSRLEPDNKAHWTAGGLPVMIVIQTMANDSSITRNDVNEAQPGFCRDLVIAKRAENPKSTSMKDFGQGSDKRNSNHQELGKK